MKNNYLCKCFKIKCYVNIKVQNVFNLRNCALIYASIIYLFYEENMDNIYSNFKQILSIMHDNFDVFQYKTFVCSLLKL